MLINIPKQSKPIFAHTRKVPYRSDCLILSQQGLCHSLNEPILSSACYLDMVEVKYFTCP